MECRILTSENSLQVQIREALRLRVAERQIGWLRISTRARNIENAEKTLVKVATKGKNRSRNYLVDVGRDVW